MEQNANEVLRLYKNFIAAWGQYVKYLKDISKAFESMQTKLKAITTGKVFGAVNKPLLEIGEIVKNRGVSSDDSVLKEIEAALAVNDEDGEED